MTGHPVRRCVAAAASKAFRSASSRPRAPLATLTMPARCDVLRVSGPAQSFASMPSVTSADLEPEFARDADREGRVVERAELRTRDDHEGKSQLPREMRDGPARPDRDE